MIRNIIFDVGNVFVRWSPVEIVERCYGLPAGTEENLRKAQFLFKHDLWIQFNLGKLSMKETELAYQKQAGLSKEEAAKIFFHVTDHQTMLEGTEALAGKLKQAGYRIFALTDNSREIVHYHNERHTFWPLFEDAVVSAEVGLIKPGPAIFRHALKQFGTVAVESVFFDDVQANVEGARSVGMEARVFTTAQQCEEDLRSLGVRY